MSNSVVEYNVDDCVAQVCINRPDKMNALNQAVLKGIEKAFRMIEEDPDVKVVVISGKGKNFVAGADIGMLEEATTYVEVDKLIQGAATFDIVENCTRPVIAAIQGIALGGGCELALAADFRYATEDAKFGLPEITLGFIPGAGGTQRLPRLIGEAKAKELLFTGKVIPAEEAYRIGLVNKVVSADRLQDEVEKLIKTLKARPPLALKLLKSCVKASNSNNKQLGLEYERSCFANLMYTDDKNEGIKALKEKRAPKFTGS